MGSPMVGHFISHSFLDGKDCALRLYRALTEHPEPVPAWLFETSRRPGLLWEDQISDALRHCTGLLFVMTVDSVRPRSICNGEMERARRYKKPIIPLLFEHDLDVPLSLGGRQWINFAHDFDAGLAELRRYLDFIDTPDGELMLLRDRLADALRDQEKYGDSNPRVASDVRELQDRIEQTERLLGQDSSARRTVERRLREEMERERRVHTRADDRDGVIVVNPPTDTAPMYFQDRYDETRLLGRHLGDNAKRLIVIVGRNGTGKSAMVCRLLEALQQCRLPDDGGRLDVHGIVFLSATPPLSVTATALLDDLSQLLRADAAMEARIYLKEPGFPLPRKVHRLVSRLPQRLVVVLIENFENLVDSSTERVRDSELAETLRALLTLPQQHAVKVVLTMQPPAPRELAGIRPGKQAFIEVGDGLPPVEARLVLRESDEDGSLGLRDAPESVLKQAYELTGGNPRALEHIVGILRSDRHTSLSEILEDTADRLRRDVAEILLGEAFGRLDRSDQQVVQALAVYGRRVTVPAVDYLLQPYMPGFDSRPSLGRLVNMRFVRKDADWYYLHQLDADHALDEVPRGTELDLATPDVPPPFTQIALFRRGAEYFRKTRHDPQLLRSIDDLRPQLSEIELLFRGDDYDAAARVLKEIDLRYLLRWGHIRKVHDEHARLRGRLHDPRLSQRNVRMLARSLQLLGDNGGAVELYLGALDRARETADMRAERKCLNSLGNSYFNMGDTERAAGYYMQAMTLARRTQQRKGEGTALSGLGLCLARRGEFQQAVERFEAALEIAREQGAAELECDVLINLGTLYTGFGETDRAEDLLGQALETARRVGFRDGEGASLAESAEVLINSGRLEEAIHRGRAAVRIAHDIESIQLAYSANYVLAVAHLFNGELNDTSVTAEMAQFGTGSRAHGALGILGIVALLRGDEGAALEAFGRAQGAASKATENGRRSFEAFDTLGLAASGLAICGVDGQLDRAIDAFRTAREITSHPGIVSRVGKLLETLEPADRVNLLEAIRPIATATGASP